MRTTLNLDDEVLPLLRRYAQSRSLPVGKAVSELVRRGLQARHPTRLAGGLTLPDLPPDSPPVTTEHVRRIEAG